MSRSAGIEKLLSHRLRGFARTEHSPSAMRAACASPVPYLELDTRATRDGRIYVYHDPSTGADVLGRCRFADASTSEVEALRFVDGEPLMSLEEAVEIFKSRALEDQRLCLDIKDHGFEREHLDAVRRAGVEDRTCFVSWIPQALTALHGLGARSPLVLSHWNTFRLGGPGRAVARLLRNRMLRLGSWVVMGGRAAVAPLDVWAHGYQHCLVCQELPGALCEILSAGGGICVHVSTVCARLADYCAANGLGLWVFSVADARQYLRYAGNPAIDVVFCDDARLVADRLGRAVPYERAAARQAVQGK